MPVCLSVMPSASTLSSSCPASCCCGTCSLGLSLSLLLLQLDMFVCVSVGSVCLYQAIKATLLCHWIAFFVYNQCVI